MMRGVRLALRLLLAAVFLYAAYTKLRQPWLLFAMSIDSYQLLPQWAVLFVARTLPWMELLLGLLLASGYVLPYAALATSAQLLVFFSIMARAYAKGLGIDCGCFGAGEALTSTAENTANNDQLANANNAAGAVPFMQTGGTIAAATDIDHIKIVVTAADAVAAPEPS